MPSKSKAQQAAMAAALQNPRPGSPSAKIAASMSKGQIEDFARTSTKGLPKRVENHYKG